MTTDWHVKHRPGAWEEVVGQDAVVASLQRVLKQEQSRAFVFTGPSGVGKTTLARILAAHVGCDRRNLIEIDAATYTGIDAMREVTSGLQYVPLHGANRVVLIDEAHALSKAAWQSLLKSVEEPPPRVFWVFCTTEPTKIPDTIKTRCHVYDLSPVKRDDVYALLRDICDVEGAKCPDEVLDVVVEASQGSPRRAITFLSQCANLKSAKDAAQILKTASGETEVVDLCRALAKGRLDWPKAMRLVAPLKDMNGESIRLTVVGYFTTMLLNAKSDQSAVPALAVLEAFSEPYPSAAGIYPVLLSLGQVIFENVE